ncbi:MAG TPA: ELM1/GtrOC1 family putative glycosyltransferase [Methylomirabilota bacterium]|nr:ELM1/GtrOC1 family putative glycosyltransferase [Methylomirabilota bacterium]
MIRGVLSNRRGPELRTRPVRVVLAATAAGPGRGKLPVRIFVGTEAAQHRAERVLLWSIEQVRDKSRIYEIHLMRDLLGFNRRLWLTGFTNYRFAIPHFAGNQGRAIYNDVDQIYLADPAELFDRDMGGHGFLAIANGPRARVPVDTSVMLIDCARMAPVWTLAAAQRGRKNALLRRALAAPGSWGRIEPAWNARDTEYAPGESKLLHYTTLHLQPWRPFPRQFVYQTNPVGHVWQALERAADAAGYLPFTQARPSDAYGEFLASLHAAGRAGGERETIVSDFANETAMLDAVPDKSLLAAVDARSIHSYRLAASADHSEPQRRILSLASGRSVACQRSTLPPADDRTARVDGVLCRQFLEHLPEDDVPWVLDKLFSAASGFVLAEVPRGPESIALADGTRLTAPRRPHGWWRQQFEAAGARHPAVRWRLALRGVGRFGRVHQGGPPLRQPPLVWVLGSDKPGHTTQSIGLAEALGWPYEVKQLRFRSVVARLHTWLLAPFGTLGASLVGLRRDRSAALAPPWPDLAIATGWRPARVALWIARQSEGHTRVVGLGRRAGQIADIVDTAVTCAHFHLPPHPRRVETLLPLSPVTPAGLAAAGERWQGLLDGLPHPRVVLLVGGSNEFYRLDAAGATRMAEAVKVFAEQAGGVAVAVTSRRTGGAATAALRAVLGASQVHEWRPGQAENPYLGYIALADALVVTGDSESMLGEAAATTKPLYIYPLPERRFGLRRRLNDWAVARAFARPLNRRGTIRPQQGFEYVFARAIASGLLPPPRDLRALHENLFRRGIARPFGQPFDAAPRPPLHEAATVAGEIRRRLGMAEPSAAEEGADAFDSSPTPASRDGLRR